MDTQITSTVIGQLIRDKDFAEWWRSDILAIPFFDNEKLQIIFMDYDPEDDKAFIKEADHALKSFLDLGKAGRQNASKYVYKNCIDFINAVDYIENDQKFRELKNENEIWQFVHPNAIYVTRRPYKDHDIYVLVECSCDWDEEHGLQLVFRQGKQLTRVSDNDGHLTEADAFDKPDEEDELLSKFK